MSKSTTIFCDKINYISATLSGDVTIEIENLDLSFLLVVNPRELLTNIDVYAVMNEMDIEEIQKHIQERKDNA